VSPSNAVLADRARAEAERHPARTPERRAAAAAYVALCDTPTLDAARRALATFTDAPTASAATRLLRQLAGQDDTTTGRTTP
jgi:hypothetical protein